MSNICKFKISIIGIRPLLQHQFTREALSLEEKEKSGVPGNDPEEWRKTCQIRKSGQLYVKPEQIFSALRDGAKHSKKGNSSLSKAVAATLQVEDNIILMNRFYPGFENNGKVFDSKVVDPPPESDEESIVYLDVRSVRNPSTKGRNIRYRVATTPGWKIEFTILFDKTVVSRDQMKKIVEDTGILEGLGDARSMGMGRFEVVSREEI